MSVTLKVWKDAEKTDHDEYSFPDLNSALAKLNSYDEALSLEERIYWGHGFVVVDQDGTVLTDISYP
jgi:hypothetical protein